MPAPSPMARTQAAMPSEPASQSAVDSVDEQLRSQGFRITNQRRLVLSAVNDLGHATADEVLAKVNEADAGVNLSTVYRSLEVLQEVGLITHAHIGHGPVTFHALPDEPHLHLVCGTCGAVESLPASDVADFGSRLRSLSGFEADLSHVALHGTCANCLARGETTQNATQHATQHATHSDHPGHPGHSGHGTPGRASSASSQP